MDNVEVGYSTANDGNVPVFDTCDVVRRKIRNFLKKPAMSKAAFLRAVSENVTDCPTFQVGQLSRFLAMKGPRRGNTCGVYYTAYVFFEQLRLQHGKSKSADRVKMEELYPCGMDISRIRNRVWAPRDADVLIDKFGVIEIRTKSHSAR